MKCVQFLLAITACLLVISACKPGGTAETPVDHYKKLYKLASKNDDYGVMANCIYNIMLVDSTATGWRDSLVQNLSDRGLYERAHNLAVKRIDKEPKNKILLTVEGMYARASGKADDALKYYRRLYTMYPDPDNAYQLAVIYFAAKQGDSCEMLTNKVLADKNTEGKMVSVETGYSGQVQKVPAKAAFLNMKGVIMAQEHKDGRAAVSYIQQALQIDPDFLFAQQILQSLMQQSGQGQRAQPGQMPGN
jgi:tetratricopeptide (TPR) repeat protein